ncbi:MAG TPA: polyprenyl synthetase family protein [Acidimicrobiales bacterium]|nr:polyprenyl synthetase family protein [Acidimicrobiales bacterium]
MTALSTAPAVTEAGEMLERARRLIGPALDQALARLSPELAAPVDHHFAGGGKYVRGALVLACAAATGAEADAAMPAAVAIELVHNFSLLHDDIIDGDLERRHRPTVWAAFGSGAAIIAGDALATLAVQVLLDDPTPARVQAAKRLAAATQAMIAGQAEDMAAERRTGLSVAECLAMETGKTGELLACAASLGAVLAAAPAEDIEGLADFGRHIGIAFQAVDDVLGIWGQAAVTGKPVGSDLRSRKKTLPVALCLELDPPAYWRLTRLLAAPEIDDITVEQATELLEGCGARAEAMAIGAVHLAHGLAALGNCRLEPAARRQLEALARFVTRRDR